MSIALAVLLEGVAVERAAVDLDDQFLVWPVHVDLVAGDRLVDLGSGQVVFVDEAEEQVLEVEAGWAGCVVFVCVTHELADARFVYGSGEGVTGQDACQVLEGAGGGGHRDAVVAGDVGAGEGAGAVGFDPAMLMVAARRHVDRTTPRWRNSPQGRGRAMTQSGTGPARQDGGHRSGVGRRWTVPDSVDAVVKAMEAADPQAVLDRIDVEPRIEELCTRDHAVLRRGQPSERQIRRRVDWT